ncbi:MAG: Transcriptional regulator SlyA [Candidatus Celerinatantimonas neptuna]|nr:MAG: Transcriptional regulator SlyA [Candidatus Celerinatantimonas neptuna]
MPHDDSVNIGFLFGDLLRAMKKSYQSHVKFSKLTFNQAKVLIHIAQSEGARQIELAERLDIQPITLARVLDQLQQQGLIERRVAPNDRRAYLLYLTSKANTELDDIHQAIQKVNKTALGNLSEQATHDFIETIRKMKSNLTQSF